MIKVDCFQVGYLATNCYLVEDEATKALAVIDPGGKSRALVNEIDKRGGRLDHILLTHGHFDHIKFASGLCDKYHPTVCISKDEKDFIKRDDLNLSSDFGVSVAEFTVDRYLSDSDTISLGESVFTFISTPGHTKGSGIYIVDNIIFSGDTLFCGSVGRTDFPTSSPADMMNSIKRINALEGDYVIYPGHDVSTTLDNERKYNPYFR